MSCEGMQVMKVPCMKKARVGRVILGLYYTLVDAILRYTEADRFVYFPLKPEKTETTCFA